MNNLHCYLNNNRNTCVNSKVATCPPDGTVEPAMRWLTILLLPACAVYAAYVPGPQNMKKTV